MDIAITIAIETEKSITAVIKRKTRANYLSLLALVSLCVLPSCCLPGCGWTFDCSKGSKPIYNSARMYLSCPGSNGLELEFVRSGEGIRLYLNVFGLEIPASDCDNRLSEVFISFGGDHSYCFVADRFLGGQRLLIPKSVQDEIIETLQDNQRVFIRTGRYQADIQPERFLKIFKSMIGGR